MVRVAPRLAGVIALGRALLLAAAGDNGGVYIQGEPVYAQAIKEPAIDLLLHLFVPRHVEAVEEAHDGFVSRHFAPTKQSGECGIKTCDFCMGKAVCSAPDADQKLLDNLYGFVATIGAGLG